MDHRVDSQLESTSLYLQFRSTVPRLAKLGNISCFPLFPTSCNLRGDTDDNDSKARFKGHRYANPVTNKRGRCVGQADHFESPSKSDWRVGGYGRAPMNECRNITSWGRGFRWRLDSSLTPPPYASDRPPIPSSPTRRNRLALREGK